MADYVVRLHAPLRGFFSGTFCAPPGWPEVLVGTCGEIAVRTHAMGEHNTVYAISAFGEALARLRTIRDEDGEDVSQVAIVILHEPHDGVAENIAFVPHPAFAANADGAEALVSRIADDAKIQHTAGSAKLSLIESTRAHQVWQIDFATGDRCFATIRSHSGILRYAVIRKPDGKLVCLTRCGHVTAEEWIENSSDHPLADLTADEIENNNDYGWYGRAAEFPYWLGVEGMESPDYADDMPYTPRFNPNNGGTDPSFGCVFLPPDLPELISPMLPTTSAWGVHPMFPRDGDSLEPLTPPPGHDDLTTHKLQLWIESADGGIGPVGGFWPMDGQHRAFMLPLTAYALTADPALRYMLELWLGAECYDRRRILRWAGNGREEGRIAYNVCAAIELGIGDRVALTEYLLDRGHTSMGAKPATGDLFDAVTIRPLFTSSRGLPWEGWTPWEEAQAAWGYWRLYQVTKVTVALEMAIERARNVAAVLVHDDGTYWIPYRVRWFADGRMPDMADPSHYKDRLYGPNGLFAWASVGLRVLLLASADERIGDVMVPTDLHQRAAAALVWMDRRQRNHVVDAHMSLRGSFGDLVKRFQ